MKIERKEVKAFKSLVITLETEVEANRFWHLVNASAARPLNQYRYRGNNGGATEVENMKHDLFDAVDIVHHPGGTEE